MGQPDGTVKRRGGRSRNRWSLTEKAKAALGVEMANVPLFTLPWRDDRLDLRREPRTRPRGEG